QDKYPKVVVYSYHTPFSATFVLTALQSPQTRCIVFKAGEPLVSVQTESGLKTLAKLPTDDLRPVLGDEPFFGQGQNAGDHAPADTKSLESARLKGPNLVFLGVHEHELDSSLPSTGFQTPTRAEDIHGTPYFALDATDIPLDQLFSCVSAQRLEFVEPRSATAKWSALDAGIFSLGRTMIDWLGRRKYCPACGSRTYALWAGWKLGCSSLLPWAENGDKPPCPSSVGLNNYVHPRTDAVVITAVLDETGNRILLGRNKDDFRIH
ncbi:NADH pyrophosphatase, partial [Ceratobasidium sp. 428]